MALNLRLQHKMAPQLVMTPELQQAIGLLQLSQLEMAAALREHIAENPVFEDDFGEHQPAAGPAASGHDPSVGAASLAPDKPATADDRWPAYADANRQERSQRPGDASGLDFLPAAPKSLAEHLNWQLQMAPVSAELVPLCHALIEEVGADGYLGAGALEQVAEATGANFGQLEQALAVVQGFEPAGVAARSLRECLLLQAHGQGAEATLLRRLIDGHLEDLARCSLPTLAKLLKASEGAVSKAVAAMRTLEPQPGRAFGAAEPAYIVPDLYVSKIAPPAGDCVATFAAHAGKPHALADAQQEAPRKADDFAITLNDDALPPLKISSLYDRSQLAAYDAATRAYLDEKLRSAHWLMRSVAMRQRTLLKVMQSILTFQRAFFVSGHEALRPLTLREVAEDVGMHESTISRVTTNKYVHTPEGTFELKFFFNSTLRGNQGEGLGSTSVRSHIERLIAQENKHAPLSDQKICDILKSRDITIARRTVAKYRKMLRKDSSSARRRGL